MKSGHEQMLAHAGEIKEFAYMISRDKSLVMPDPSVANYSAGQSDISQNCWIASSVSISSSSFKLSWPYPVQNCCQASTRG